MKKATHKNLDQVWERLMAYAQTKDDRNSIAEALNEMLDNLALRDFFGTEGQCDPRGDQRP